MRIVLVAGTNHLKIATALQRTFQARKVRLYIVTQNTGPATVAKYLQSTSISIWLVSPQTVRSKWYVQLHQYFDKHQIFSFPIIVQPVAHLPFRSAGIPLQKSAEETVRLAIHSLKLPVNSLSPRKELATIHWGVASILLLFLAVVVVLTAMLSSKPIEAALPTLVAADPLMMGQVTDVEQPAATDTSEVIDQAWVTETNTIEQTTLTPVSATQVEAEMTEIVDAISSTAESTEEPVNQTPQLLLANFTASVTRGDAPLTIELVNESMGNITAYSWDYESDGIVDSFELEPPPVTYQMPGVYTITLSIRDVNGTVVQSENVIEVYDSVESDKAVVNRGRTFASFVSSPSSGKFPLKVQFINRSEGTDASYEWDFNGDSKIDFVGASPPQYEYKEAGSYTARLVAITDDGDRDEAQARISVYSTEPEEPAEAIYDVDAKANFEVSVTNGKVPFRVSITNLSLGENNSYEWDFDGDGEADSAAEQPPQQRYAQPGTYPIDLTVYGFDRFGNPKISRAQIQITALPRTPATSSPTSTPEVFSETELEADFFASTTEGDAPLTVEFFNFSFGDDLSYQWDFDGDGEIDSTAFEPTFTFTTGGEYDVLLRVSDGQISSESQLTIVVNATTGSVTAQPTPTLTPSNTYTATVTPSITPTATATTKNVIIISTATPTITPTKTMTLTLTMTHTVTWTPSPTLSHTPTWTPTHTHTFTPTHTHTPTWTLTHTHTFTPTYTHTPTWTPSHTHTFTPTDTYTPTSTHTPTDMPESDTSSEDESN